MVKIICKSIQKSPLYKPGLMNELLVMSYSFPHENIVRTVHISFNLISIPHQKLSMFFVGNEPYEPEILILLLLPFLETYFQENKNNYKMKSLYDEDIKDFYEYLCKNKIQDGYILNIDKNCQTSISELQKK